MFEEKLKSLNDEIVPNLKADTKRLEESLTEAIEREEKYKVKSFLTN